MFSSKHCDKTSAVFDSFLNLIFHREYKAATKRFARAWHFPWNVGLSLDTFEVFSLDLRFIKCKRYKTQ